MIEQLDTQNFGGVSQAGGYLVVLIAGKHYSRRVIMRYDHRGGVVGDGRAEHLAGVYDCSVDKTYGYDVPFYYFVDTVQGQANKMFLRFSGKAPQKGVTIFRQSYVNASFYCC
jgi:hypothetical protein